MLNASLLDLREFLTMANDSSRDSGDGHEIYYLSADRKADGCSS